MRYIKTIEERENLLNECRLKFPVGTEFNSMLGRFDKITRADFKFYDNYQMIAVEGSGTASGEGRRIWDNGSWADILFTPVSVSNSYLIY